ncbi:MAG: VanZ family protein [Clostridia bacterium]|nr:VanZ family protein [Clostridia bacterium]
MKKSTTVGHEISRLLLHLTIVAILSQTMTPGGKIADFRFHFSIAEQYYNFVPFNAAWRMLKMSGQKAEYFFVVNILGNILIFLPVGFFHRLSEKCKFENTVLFGFFLSLFIELVQVILPRTTDIDDIIMNTAGTVLGALLCVLCEKVFTHFKRGEADNLNFLKKN